MLYGFNRVVKLPIFLHSDFAFSTLNYVLESYIYNALYQSFGWARGRGEMPGVSGWGSCGELVFLIPPDCPAASYHSGHAAGAHLRKHIISNRMKLVFSGVNKIYF
jgi:hypothetical protein